MRTSTVETGDMIRTSDGWANIQKKITAQITDLCAVIGSVFLPDIRKAGQAFIDFLTQDHINTIQRVTSAFWELGKTISRVAIAITTMGISELTPRLKELYSFLTSQFQSISNAVASSQIGPALSKMKESLSGYGSEVATQMKSLYGMITGNTESANQAMTNIVQKSNQANIDISTQTGQTAGTMKNIWVEYYNFIGEHEEANKIQIKEKYTELLAMHQWTADERERIEKELHNKLEEEDFKAMKKKEEREKQYFRLIYDNMVTTFNTLGNYLEGVGQKDIARLDRRKNMYSKVIDAMNLKDEEKAALNMWIDFEADRRKHAIAYKTAVYAKTLALAQTVINTAQAVSAAITIPVAGLVLAPIVAALGAAQVGLIAATPIPAAYEGGLIQGSQGGTLIRAGEMGKSEAIIPLENPEAREKLGGMGATYNISFDGAILANEALPERFLEAIDRGLYKLNKSRNSIFAEAIR
jgi:hypothetical protein